MADGMIMNDECTTADELAAQASETIKRLLGDDNQ
jgi:hypothetical protein